MKTLKKIWDASAEILGEEIRFMAFCLIIGIVLLAVFVL